MKVKVIEAYTDKYTGEQMDKGMVHEYGAERANELIAGGYVKEAKAAKKKEAK